MLDASHTFSAPVKYGGMLSNNGRILGLFSRQPVAAVASMVLYGARMSFAGVPQLGFIVRQEDVGGFEGIYRGLAFDLDAGYGPLSSDALRADPAAFKKSLERIAQGDANDFTLEIDDIK